MILVKREFNDFNSSYIMNSGKDWYSSFCSNPEDCYYGQKIEILCVG